MSTTDIKNTKILKQWGQALGREGIADMIEKIAKEIIEGRFSYASEVIIRAGKIRALTEACKYDQYWNEKAFIGFNQILQRAELELKKNEEKHENS